MQIYKKHSSPVFVFVQNESLLYVFMIFAVEREIIQRLHFKKT